MALEVGSRLGHYPATAPIGGVMCRLTRTGIVAWLAVGLVAFACGDGPSSPSDPPNLTILLTDDLTDDVERVDIAFVGVTAKPVGQPVQRLDLALTETVDLLTLSDEVITLATGVVEPGEYEFIQVDLDEDESSIVELGVRQPLRVPSEEVKILGGFTIGEDQETTLTLDFDADESLIQLGNGNWLMRPVIVMTGNNTSSQ